MQDQPDSPGVVIFPPLLMGLALLAVGTLHWLWPLPISTRPVALAFGIVLGILGVGLAAWGHRTLVKGGTNVSPLKPTTAIVIAGPFRFTRNPLYVGVMTLLLGLSLAMGAWWGFVASSQSSSSCTAASSCAKSGILSGATPDTNPRFADIYDYPRGSQPAFS
jgi:hypothetical protein